MEKLVELSDNEILIDFALHTKCRTTIRLKSLIYNAPLAFKVQTSSPHKFLVNPPSGLIPPLSSSAFQIVLKPQPHLPAAFPRSPSDRFLLKTAAAPDLSPDLPESTRSDVASRWFSSAPHRRTFDVKLKVYFVGPFLLAHAVAAGDFEAVRSIAKRQRTVVSELPPREAESLYRVAAQSPDIMGLLLEAGLRVDVRPGLPDDFRWGPRGRTDLHVAAFDRTEEVEEGDRRLAVNFLGAGADPTTAGDVDCCCSAIDVARDKGHTDIGKVVERGESVIHAARRGELDVLESLLGKGASSIINSRDHYGLTPLHVAAIKGNIDAVTMLVEFGADLDCRDAQGHTPLHLSVQGGMIEVVKILVTRGASVNARTKKGATPLCVARLMEYDDITRLLVDKGAVSVIAGEGL